MVFFGLCLLVFLVLLCFLVVLVVVCLCVLLCLVFLGFLCLLLVPVSSTVFLFSFFLCCSCLLFPRCGVFFCFLWLPGAALVPFDSFSPLVSFLVLFWFVVLSGFLDGSSCSLFFLLCVCLSLYPPALSSCVVFPCGFLLSRSLSFPC